MYFVLFQTNPFEKSCGHKLSSVLAVSSYRAIFTRHYTYREEQKFFASTQMMSTREYPLLILKDWFSLADIRYSVIGHVYISANFNWSSLSSLHPVQIGALSRSAASHSCLSLAAPSSPSAFFAAFSASSVELTRFSLFYCRRINRSKSNVAPPAPRRKSGLEWIARSEICIRLPKLIQSYND